MSKMRLEKSKKKSTLNGKGFYIALGVCLIAIGAAAWTTYSSVMDFLTPTTESSTPGSVSSAENRVVDNPISGIPKETSSAAEKPSPEESSGQEEEKAASQVDSKPEQSSLPAPERNTSSEASSVQLPVTGVTMFPAGNTVLSPFSGTDPVYSPTMEDWRTHNGTDFAVSKGTAVKAITSGLVKDIYDDPLWGSTVVIEHEGNFTAFYSGLGNTTLVKTGDIVKIGQDIGSVHDVPAEMLEDSHLHLGIQKDGQWIDPMTVLGKTQGN